MKLKDDYFPIIFAAFFVVLLLAALVGAFYLLITLVGLEGSLIWSTLIAAIGWMISEHISRRREHERLLAEQKRLMYFEFLDFMQKIIDARKKAGETGTGITEEMIRDLTRWSLRLALVASDGVVKAWNDFRTGAGADTTKVFHAVGQLLSEMRKDCGHYGSNLSKFDLLSVLIKTEDLMKLHGTLEAKN